MRKVQDKRNNVSFGEKMKFYKNTPPLTIIHNVKGDLGIALIKLLDEYGKDQQVCKDLQEVLYKLVKIQGNDDVLMIGLNR